MSAALDLYRDLRDAASEAAFFEVYGNMMSLQMADERAEIRKQDASSIRARCRRCARCSTTIDQGGAPKGDRAHRDADQQGGRRQAHACRRCSDARALLAPKARSRTCREDERRRLLQEETIVVEFEPLQRASARCRSSCAAQPIAQKLNVFFDSLEADSGLDARQHALLAELRELRAEAAGRRAVALAEGRAVAGPQRPRSRRAPLAAGARNSAKAKGRAAPRPSQARQRSSMRG